MTGFRSSKMRWNCDRDGCYHDKLPCWDDINDCFPGAIRPTDIDGMVEINGRVLFLEQKDRDAIIETGQRRAFIELSKKQDTTVAVIRGGIDTELQLLVYRNGEGSYWQDITRPDLLGFLQHWAEQAINTAPAQNWRLKVRALEEQVASLEAQNQALKLEIFAVARETRGVS